MKKPHVWLIEYTIFNRIYINDFYSERKQARLRIKELRKFHPEYKFRVAKYVRES